MSFTWALVYQEQADEAKGRALVSFLWWAMRDGQVYARDLNYAPLPCRSCPCGSGAPGGNASRSTASRRSVERGEIWRDHAREHFNTRR